MFIIYPILIFINYFKYIYVMVVFSFIYGNIRLKFSKKIGHNIFGYASYVPSFFYHIRQYLVAIFYLFYQEHKFVTKIFGHFGLMFIIQNIQHIVSSIYYINKWNFSNLDYFFYIKF